MDVSHHFAVRYPDLAAFPAELDERISVHGLHLKTQKDVQIGERVGLQFRFPQREEPLRAVGVVAWVAPQPDASGKRSLVVRQITFDQASRDILDLVRQTPVVAPAEAVPTPPPAAVPPAPTPPAAQSPTPAPAASSPAPSPVPATAQPDPEATFTVPPAVEPEGNNGPEPPTRSGRKGLWVLLFLLLIGAGLATWIFAFGGRQFIEVRFMSPPQAYNVALAQAVDEGVQPPVPGAPAPPPPKPKPRPLVAVGFDYFQRPAVNEFIITFNRAPEKILTNRLPSPLMQVFYVDGARVKLEKEQYFLPFDFVRAVYFEHQDGVLRISFVAQNPNYLPEPVWEQRGRELLIRFVATD